MMWLERISRAAAVTAWGLLITFCCTATSVTAIEDDPEKLEFFEKKIRPVLVGKCFACHSAETKPAGGLRVDDFNGLIAGGNSGAGIVPGNPDESLLLKRVTDPNENRRMPRETTFLSEDQIADLRKWIDEGAIWPAPDIPDDFTGDSENWYKQLREEHWAWQRLSEPSLPPVQDSSWARDPIDQFVLASLEAVQLSPMHDADKGTLLRRVTYDLTGLPPTLKDLEAFLDDSDSTAFERVVDRLLASPAFGERWGRHWLDVARYAESTGPSRNIPYPHAWNYRDYVFDSIQADVPYDRFLQEQIAGDLLPADSAKERDRLSIATGFLALGVKDVNQRFQIRFDMDNVDDQIDVVTRSVLAMTVTCARCHDHKFDPIPITDYYALAGIFTSTVNAAGLRNQMGGSGMAYYVPENLVMLEREITPPPEELVAELTEQVAQAKAKWDGIRGTPEGLKLRPNGQPFQRRFRLEYEKLQNELHALTDPAIHGGAVHGVREAETIADTHVRLRGEAEHLGPIVPRGVLTTLHVPDTPAIPSEQSGRLQLAQWLTSTHNPLTPRVAVNRVWHHLFGRGIVSTVDNFGYNGNVPTHPELLDYLALQFVEDGWSLKRLIRRLVLTRTYQLSSEADAEHLAVDPANRLLWRHTPRRLAAEEIRDSILAVSGQLNSQRPEGSPAKSLAMKEIRDDGPEANQMRLEAENSLHRSVYLPLLRGIIPGTFEVFDPVEQSLVTGAREQTTVPSQALFLLNSGFVRQHALKLAERLYHREELDDSSRIREAFRLTLGRNPDSDELVSAHEFLASYIQDLHGEPVETTDPGGLASTEPTTVKRTEVPIEVASETFDGSQTSESAVKPAAAVTSEGAIPPAAPEKIREAWLAFVQALLGSAEFRHIR